MGCFFLSLFWSVSTDLLKGDAGVNVLCHSGWCSLNGPVYTRRVPGLLWSWGALINSQITSNCHKQKFSLFLSTFVDRSFYSCNWKYKGPPSSPSCRKTHTYHTITTSLPGSSVDCSLLAMPARWHLQISTGQKRKRGRPSLSYRPKLEYIGPG